jgi:hypothetical protein
MVAGARAEAQGGGAGNGERPPGHAGFDAIAFNMGYLKGYLEGKSRIARLAYHPEWNSFRGQRRIQLRVVALE